MSNLEALRAGILAAKAGKRMLARIQFEQATEIDSLCPHSWLWFAWASESPTEAMEYVDKALAIAPDHPFAQAYRDVLRGFCDYSVEDARTSTMDAFHRAALLTPTSDVAPLDTPACEPAEETCLSTRQHDRATSLTLSEADIDEDQDDSDVEETELDLDELVSSLEDEQEDSQEYSQEAEPEESPTDLAAIQMRDELFCDSELDSCTFASENEPFAYNDHLEDGDLEEELVPSELVEDELADEQLVDEQILDEELADEELLQDELYEEESLMSEALDAECETDDFQDELEVDVEAVEMVDATSRADVQEAIVLEDRSTANMEMDAQDALNGSVDEDQILLDTRAIQSDVQAATEVVLEATPVMLDQTSSTEAATTLVRTVLAVDDSPTVLRLVAMTLEAAGYEVVTAPNGVEAMKLLANLTPALVLLDVNMPRMDGYKLCKLLKSHDKTRYIPVVMLSGKDGLFDKLRGKLVGCDDYLSKPFESVELLRHVARYVPLPDPVVS